MRKFTAAAIALTLGGCGVGNFTPLRSYSTNDELALQRPARDFVEVTSEVGRSLGYNLAGVDRGTNTVSFTDNASVGMSMVMGKFQQIGVSVALQPGGRSVRFDIQMSGNMSSASQGKANERLGRFKAALAQRL